MTRSGPKKGYRQTEEHRANLSAALKGKTKSAEHKAKIAASMTGQKRTAEQCANISAGKRNANPSPTYRAVHARLGSASLYQCSCGNQARDWAYQKTCPDPLYDSKGMPYSKNPEDYKPMCRKCHNDFDGIEERRTADGTFR